MTEIVDREMWDHYSELPNPSWYEYKNKEEAKKITMKITIYVHPEDLSDLGEALNTFTSNMGRKEEIPDDGNEMTLVDFIRISLFPHEGFVQTIISYEDYVTCTDLDIFDETTRV